MRNILISLIILLFACTQRDTVKNTEKTVYHFGPDTSLMEGVLKRELFYGPPNFGDDTVNDAKEYCYILHLDSFIKVVPLDLNNKDPFDEASDSIITIQLILNNYDSYKPYINHKIKVKGQLFGASTGHHHTKVLIDNVELIK